MVSPVTDIFGLVMVTKPVASVHGDTVMNTSQNEYWLASFQKLIGNIHYVRSSKGVQSTDSRSRSISLAVGGLTRGRRRMLILDMMVEVTVDRKPGNHCMSGRNTTRRVKLCRFGLNDRFKPTDQDIHQLRSR